MQHMRLLLLLLVFSSLIFDFGGLCFYASMERARIISCIYRAR